MRRRIYHTVPMIVRKGKKKPPDRKGTAGGELSLEDGCGIDRLKRNQTGCR